MSIPLLPWVLWLLLPPLFAVTLGEAPEAHAKEPTQIAATTGLPGKPVELKYGRGYDPYEAAVLRNVIEEKGCPTEVSDGGPYKGLSVSVGGETYKSRDSIKVPARAVELCLNNG